MSAVNGPVKTAQQLFAQKKDQNIFFYLFQILQLDIRNPSIQIPQTVKIKKKIISGKRSRGHPVAPFLLAADEIKSW